MKLGASARQIMMEFREGELVKLPLFKTTGVHDIRVGGFPAIVHGGKYFYQGNVDWAELVDEIFAHDKVICWW